MKQKLTNKRYYKFLVDKYIMIAETDTGFDCYELKDGQWYKNDNLWYPVQDALHDYGDYSIDDIQPVTYEEIKNIINKK